MVQPSSGWKGNIVKNRKKSKKETWPAGFGGVLSSGLGGTRSSDLGGGARSFPAGRSRLQSEGPASAQWVKVWLNFSISQTDLQK